MQSCAPVTTDLVLLGAGHAHVEVLRRFAMRPEPGLRLTLIGREPETPYSGMLPGLIRRDYRFEQAHIDLAPLAASSGARLIVDEAVGLDLQTRAVALAGRPEIPFDLLSIDVGGEPAMPDGAGVPVKPIGRFLAQLEALEAHLHPGARIAVVGAGPAGTELALALAHRLGDRARITLVCSEADPLPAAPKRARAVARAALVEAHVEMVFGVTAGRREAGRLALSDGSFLDADEVLWATNVVAPGFLAASGLACDESGCVRVDRTLRSVSHVFVFAAGDCASVDGAARPKAGVWAVRAGAPLAANLRRSARARVLRNWRPQREALVLLGLGDGRAIGWRNGIAVSGAWVWRWKDYIDRRWMRMYQQLKPMPEDSSAPMRCGGCGAKVGAEVLAGALATLTRTPSPDILLGLDHPDDGAVTLPPPGMAVVQSVDHFRAFLDDPYLFGQIAAAHALSDLHAMGARPWTALAIAAVPYMRSDKMRAELAAMMRGATETLEGDGCALVGGHSGEAAETALGFSVTGLVDPAKVTRKSGLRPGDALILTKALGTGIILAANMRGRRESELARSHDQLDAPDECRSGAGSPRARRPRLHRRHRVRPRGAPSRNVARVRGCRRARYRCDTGAARSARTLRSRICRRALVPENARALRNAGIADLRRWRCSPIRRHRAACWLASHRGARRIALRSFREAGLTAAIIGWMEPHRPRRAAIALCALNVPIRLQERRREIAPSVSRERQAIRTRSCWPTPRAS